MDDDDNDDEIIYKKKYRQTDKNKSENLNDTLTICLKPKQTFFYKNLKTINRPPTNKKI